MLHGRHYLQHEDITMTAEICMAKATEKIQLAVGIK